MKVNEGSGFAGFSAYVGTLADSHKSRCLSRYGVNFDIHVDGQVRS